jgi:branched-chain amino acid transport system substrate-binding protein
MKKEKLVAQIALTISSRPGRAAKENPIFRGMQIAMDELKNDDTFPVQLDWKVFDDFANKETAEKLALEIVKDLSIIGVVGSMGSDETFANAPIFHKADLVQVSPCASHPDLCRQGYRTFFRLVANENLQGGALASIAYNYLNSRQVAIVHVDDLWGVAVSEVFEQEFSKLGGSIIQKVVYQPTEDDFSGLITAMGAAKPDLVLMAVHAVEGPTISSGLRESGLRVPFLGTDAMKPVFPLGGGETGEQAYHTHSGADFRRLPGASAFRKAYSSRFDEDSTYSPEAYDACMLIAQALRFSGHADRARVLEWVRNVSDFQGVSGIINFDQTGERIDAPISCYRVAKTEKGREMEYLGTFLELLSRD